MLRAGKLAAVAFVAVLVMAACGDDDDTSVTGTLAPTTTVAPTTTAPTRSAAPTTTAATAAATVTVASTSLGDVLADAQGRTLYVFMMDTPDTSNCTGGCLSAWPRYAPAAVSAGPGVDASLLGTITVDGGPQATVAQRPLYYFASDTAPGDVKGQGVGGNWWVVAADGTPIEG
jgi:predicted lipoprotein with Yx(FWY)xxD motif